MTEEIIIDVSNCSHKSDDDCMEMPFCNEYGDLMGYQSCEAQTLCPYRSQKKIDRLEQENKELKEENNLLAYNLYLKEQENNQMKSALGEINLILDELKQQYDYMTDYSEIKEIQDKINEVLGNE